MLLPFLAWSETECSFRLTPRLWYRLACAEVKPLIDFQSHHWVDHQCLLTNDDYLPDCILVQFFGAIHLMTDGMLLRQVDRVRQANRHKPNDE